MGNGTTSIVDSLAGNTGVSRACVWVPYGNLSIGNRFVNCADIARILHHVTNLHRQKGAFREQANEGYASNRAKST
jgi:hypothetical protein